MTEIQNAVKTANVSGSTSRDLVVRSAQLTLNVVAASSGGGKIDFRVPVIGLKLSLGAKVARTDTHTITVTLVPPEPDEHEVRTGEVSRVLVEAIETIRRIIGAAADGPERMVMDSSSVELTFAVTEEGTISLGVDGELRDELTHTVKLEFGPAR
ncbi:trypco2 family protein [Asanoa iriomotensis]|uniref:trypco2 family protein n=1 Tax=Asanoa iriomotensis TaxID=234613 RepID=UPI0019430F45|nr:trypco2 family protein [Asanoa iriomotensis]